jgi:hypothetical protein
MLIVKYDSSSFCVNTDVAAELAVVNNLLQPHLDVSKWIKGSTDRECMFLMTIAVNRYICPPNIGSRELKINLRGLYAIILRKSLVNF